MRLFLHICCSICLSKALTGLRKEFGKELDLQTYWYNPNIHPLIEYRRRLKSAYMLGERIGIAMKTDDDYGVKEFCKLTSGSQEVPQRCEICYEIRFKMAAKRAKSEGYDYFATTLTTSEHQSHELISKVAEREAEKAGIKFLYRDWRKEERDEKLLNGLYKQQYCGCIFSEYDRYKDTKTHLYKGNTGE